MKLKVIFMSENGKLFYFFETKYQTYFQRAMAAEAEASREARAKVAYSLYLLLVPSNFLVIFYIYFIGAIHLIFFLLVIFFISFIGAIHLTYFHPSYIFLVIFFISFIGAIHLLYKYIGYFLYIFYWCHPSFIQIYWLFSLHLLLVPSILSLFFWLFVIVIKGIGSLVAFLIW